MKCPACGKEMTAEDFGGVTIDVCTSGCKGMWFDWAELEKLDENNEGMGNALEAALKAPRVNDENRDRLVCTKCNKPMYVHKYKHSKAVNIDECYFCRGFFLDSGELSAIRGSYMSDEERERYVQGLLNDTAGFAEAKMDLAARKKRADALRHLTRHVRLSYYFTGK